MLRSLALAFWAVTASACMVGDPGSAPVSEAPASSTEQPDETPGTTTSIALTLDQGLDAEERAFLAQLNNYRVANNLAPLQVSVALSQASDFHSHDMAAKNYFSHDSQDGTVWSDRIRRYYDHNTYLAENIAAGNDTGGSTFTQWKNSPGHDANMRGANYRVIGIARAYDANATYRWYWTTDFGGYVDEVMTPTDTQPPPPPPPSAVDLLVNSDFAANDLVAGVPYTSIRDTGHWYVATANGAATVNAGVLTVNDALVGNISVGQLAEVSTSTAYDVHATVRWISGGTGQVLYVDFLDASYNRIGRTTLVPGGSSTAHDITSTVTAPAGAAFARLTIYGYTGNNDYSSTYEWDNITLVAR